MILTQVLLLGDLSVLQRTFLDDELSDLSVWFSVLMLQIHWRFCLRCSAHTWMRMWFWVTLVRCLPLVWLLPHAAHGQGKGAGPDSDGFPGLLDMFFLQAFLPDSQKQLCGERKKPWAEELRTFRGNCRPVTVPLLQVFLQGFISADSLEFSGSTSDWLRELFCTTSITHWMSIELFCLDKIRTQDWWHVQTRLLLSADYIPESWNHDQSNIVQSNKKTTLLTNVKSDLSRDQKHLI